jgi:hypothetical protein
LRIDDDHAFDHPSQNRFHPGAVAGQFCDSDRQLAIGVVQRLGDGPDLVVVTAAGQAAAAIAARGFGDRPDPVADLAGDHERQRGSGQQAEPDRAGYRQQDRRQLGTDGRQRQREPHHRHARVPDGHRHIEHVGFDGVAEPPRGAQLAAYRGSDFGPERVVLERGQLRERLGRVADDLAAGGDEGGAGAGQRRNPVGFGVKARSVGLDRRSVPLQHFGGESCLDHQRILSAEVDLAGHHHREQPARDDQREQDGDHPAGKDLQLETRAHVSDPRAARQAGGRSRSL